METAKERVTAKRLRFNFENIGDTDDYVCNDVVRQTYLPWKCVSWNFIPGTESSLPNDQQHYYSKITSYRKKGATPGISHRVAVIWWGPQSPRAVFSLPV